MENYVVRSIMLVLSLGLVGLGCGLIYAGSLSEVVDPVGIIILIFGLALIGVQIWVCRSLNQEREPPLLVFRYSV
jgi:hypothetical protein